MGAGVAFPVDKIQPLGGLGAKDEYTLLRVTPESASHPGSFFHRFRGQITTRKSAKNLMKRFIVILAVALTTQVFAGLALARESKPVATLVLSEGQVGVGVGWSWGHGTLIYKGKRYPFKVEGLSIGDVGITKATATGRIYKMNSLSDFSGTYAAATAEGTLVKGAGATAMKNEHGVELQLYPKTKGVNLKLAGEGVKFTLQK